MSVIIFYPMLFSVSYLISFFSFFVCVFIHVHVCWCWHVCGVYAIHMCMSIWRPEVNPGCCSSDAVHLFWDRFPHWPGAHWLSCLHLLSSRVQVCTTRPGLHGCMASVSLTEPSPQTLILLPVTRTFMYSCQIIYVPMCICLDFPKSFWFLLFFLPSAWVGSSMGFVHWSGFLGWLLPTSHSFLLF